MTDQMRAIDNKRLTKKTGLLPQDLSELVKQNVKIVMDID
jgi:mRNA interferase MazF